MKRIVAYLLVLIILLLGTYYAMGYLTEKKIKQDLAIVNQSNGLAVDLRSYQRGLFTSKVNFDLHFRPPKKLVQPQSTSPLVQPTDLKIQLPVTIYHGPIIFAKKGIKFGLGYAYTDLDFPQEYNNQFNELFTSESIKPHLILSLFLSYVANTTIESNIPLFKLFSKKGDMKMEWSGLTSLMRIASDLDHIKGYFNLRGLNLILNKFEMKVLEGETHYQLYRTEKPELLLGDATLSLPSLALTEDNRSLIELDHFKIHSNSDVKEGLFSLSLDASADKMKLREETYDQSKLDFAIRNLDADIVAKLENQLHNLQKGGDIQRQGTFLAILTELPALLNKAPEVEVKNLAFTTSEGQISGKLKLSLPKDGMANPLDFTQKIQGEGALKIPSLIVKEVLAEAMKEKLLSSDNSSKQAIQQIGNTENNIQAAMQSAEVNQNAVALADKQLAVLLENGFLKEEGAYYVIEASLSQGKVLVNGKPFDLENVKF